MFYITSDPKGYATLDAAKQALRSQLGANRRAALLMGRHWECPNWNIYDTPNPGLDTQIVTAQEVWDESTT